MMDRYGQFCPIAKALELIGSRWTPLILRELLAGSCRFSELQRSIPLISRSLLAQRLRQMEEDGLLTATEKMTGRGFEYRLTDSGFAALPVLEALAEWGLRFAQGRITPEDCEPAQMMWAIRRYAEPNSLPDCRFVIRFEFRNLPPSRRSMTTWWLIWDRGEFDHCLDNPGHEVDLVVNTLIDTFARVWMGGIGLTDALRVGSIRFEGSPVARQTFVEMLDFRPYSCVKVFRLTPAEPSARYPQPAAAPLERPPPGTDVVIASSGTM
jgi:DNA-binding HxlR family transcriptional regulator